MKRGLVAVSIGILIWISTGVTVGFVTADNAEAPHMETVFRIGDQAAYNFTDFRGTGYMELDWIGPRSLLAPNGSTVQTNLLQVRTLIDGEQTADAYFFQGAEVVAHEYSNQITRTTGTIAPETQEVQQRVKVFDPLANVCFVQWMDISFGEEMPIQNCLFGDGAEEIQYSGAGERLQFTGNGVSYSFIPGIPFPAQVELERMEGVDSYELVSFRAGGTELDASTSWSAPRVRMTPTDHKGPALSGEWNNHDAYDYLVSEGAIEAGTSLVSANTYTTPQETRISVGFTDKDRFNVVRQNADLGLLPLTEHTSYGGMRDIRPQDVPVAWPEFSDVEWLWAQLGHSAEVHGFSVQCMEKLPLDDCTLGPTVTGSLASWTPTSYLVITHSDAAATRAMRPISPPEAPVIESNTWTFPQVATTSGLGALGLLAGLLYYFKPTLVGLFSRNPSAVQPHPTRQQLMGLISANPGIHFQALLRDAALPNATARHHLDLLQRANQVQRLEALGKSCYFPAGQNQTAMLEMIAMNTPGARDIMDSLRQGAATISELATALGLARSTVSHHVARLHDLDLVHVVREGRTSLVTRK